MAFLDLRQLIMQLKMIKNSFDLIRKDSLSKLICSCVVFIIPFYIMLQSLSNSK